MIFIRANRKLETKIKVKKNKTLILIQKPKHSEPHIHGSKICLMFKKWKCCFKIIYKKKKKTKI